MITVKEDLDISAHVNEDVPHPPPPQKVPTDLMIKSFHKNVALTELKTKEP